MHLLESLFGTLTRLRQKPPLIHSITNQVASQRTADILLAIGFSPLMAHEYAEMSEIASCADVLSLNIGTLDGPQLKSMEKAAEEFKKRGKNWVLDPVGAGISTFRRQACERLLSLSPSIIRGNASEILALAGEKIPPSGVDSQNSVREAHDAAGILARKTKSLIVVSGAEDYLTDGEKTAQNRNGDIMMSKITGTGCALTAVMAGFLTKLPAFEAAHSALVFYTIAGEIAAAKTSGPGQFSIAFLDSLCQITRQQLYDLYKQ